MRTVIIDAGIGNLHSANKAFQRMARELQAGDVCVSERPDEIARADRLVLPGDGAFAACKRALAAIDGMIEAITEAVLEKGRPFFGICVGMQLLASEGREYEITAGLGWIPGVVDRIQPQDPRLKIPHMGWNDLVLTGHHPVLDGVKTGDHAYFVHSYQLVPEELAHRFAHVDYGGVITAIVARETIFATQFHPEKSQAVGLRLIGNFLLWRP